MDHVFHAAQDPLTVALYWSFCAYCVRAVYRLRLRHGHASAFAVFALVLGLVFALCASTGYLPDFLYRLGLAVRWEDVAHVLLNVSALALNVYAWAFRPLESMGSERAAMQARTRAAEAERDDFEDRLHDTTRRLEKLSARLEDTAASSTAFLPRETDDT